MRTAKWITVFLTATSLGCLRLSAQVPDTPPPVPAHEQPEVLSRGPVHEAFAEPVSMKFQTGLIAPQQPPPNIAEVPPPERPQGSQFAWIPGYWAWDADRNGYIWISACWRAAPPSMSWVPGYWTQVSGGWEWVSGYWAPAGVRNIAYLPPPPEVEDLEPVIVQTSPDTIWVPPCMYWSDGQYIRRSGYWLKAQPNWVWIPSHYVRTPRGCIFAEGHWDYALERRGVLFAPVYFPAPVYLRTSFTFSPSIVIDVGLLQVNLFAYPRYGHYYFGDYYDGAYLSIGIFPWFESRRYHTWYDPVYEHSRWQHHHSEPRWEEHERDEYRRRCDDKNLRPAHTFREQESRLEKTPEQKRHNFQVTQPIGTAITRQKSSMKFEKIDTDARQKISRQAAAVHTFSDERTRWESPAIGSKAGQPSVEHKTVMPPTELKRVTPPTEESKKPVSRSVEHRQATQPVEEHKATVMPSTERRQTIHPTVEHKTVVTAPDSQQGHTFTPARETQVSQPERVQIPAPPVTGKSGKQGIFKKGPPTRPADELNDHIDWDNRRK